MITIAVVVALYLTLGLFYLTNTKVPGWLGLAIWPVVFVARFLRRLTTLGLVLGALLLTGCASREITLEVTPVIGRYTVEHTTQGVFIVTDTTDGHSWIVMPEGVLDLGTVFDPIMRARLRPGYDEDTEKSDGFPI